MGDAGTGKWTCSHLQHGNPPLRAKSKRARHGKLSMDKFEMEDSTAGSAPPSRPQTGASQASRCSNASRAQSRVSSRAAESPDQRKKLIELKAKLTAALEEVESELGETQRLK